MKEQEKKTWKKIHNEIKINNLPDKKFKALVIRTLTELGKRMYEHSENFNKELENIEKNQSKLKNTITEMKMALEGTNSRLGDTEEWIPSLEDRIIKITQLDKNFKKLMKTV